MMVFVGQAIPSRNPLDVAHMSTFSPSYTRTAVFLHWLIAGLIVTNLVLAWSVDYLPESWERFTVDTHKSIGITVLGLVLMRILWRVGHPPPPTPPGHAAWERFMATAVHLLMYAVMLVLPVTGWMHDSAWKDAATHPLKLFGVIPWPRLPWITDVAPVAREVLHKQYHEWHELAADVLYVLFALHVAGALKHQFRDHEAQFRRMWW
jgi:cytochrome b561